MGLPSIVSGMSVDVLIIGGGVIGLSAAWRLAQSGLKVRVVDRQDMGREASWAGAGIIPPGLMGDAASWLGRLYAESKRSWPLWTEELRSLVGIDNGYHRCGGIELVDDVTAIEADIRSWNQVDESATELDAAALKKLEPELHLGTHHAYHLPGLAQVRNPWHLNALQAACLKAGVELRPFLAAETFKTEGYKITGCKTVGGIMQAGHYVVAGGAWSQSLLQGVGMTCNIEPIKGQIALLKSPPGLMKHVIEVGPRYIVPRRDGYILIGSTEERVGFDKSTSSEGIKGLHQFAASLVPKLAELPIERAWAGLRPWLADGPFVGRATDHENLTVATGHFRSGLTLSPATAMLLTTIITGNTPSGGESAT